MELSIEWVHKDHRHRMSYGKLWAMRWEIRLVKLHRYLNRPCDMYDKEGSWTADFGAPTWLSLIRYKYEKWREAKRSWRQFQAYILKHR